MVYRADPETLRTTYTNNLVEKVYGYTPKEWLDNPNLWESIIHPEDRDRVFKEITRHRKKAMSGRIEYRVIKKDRSIGWCEDIFNWRTDEKGKVTGLNGLVIEITNKKLAEEALRQSEERFRALIEKGADVILVVNEEGILEYVSPTFENTLGRKVEEIQGRQGMEFIEGFVHPDDIKAISVVFMECLREPGSQRSARCRYKHSDGTWHSLEAMGRNRMDDPVIKGMILNIRDITDRVRAREELEASLKEKEVLLKEIHHRVKNNMQMMSRQLYRDSQNRISSMALVHEELYKSGNVASINISDYLHTMIENLFVIYGDRKGKINHDIQIDDISLNIDTAIPLGLIISELISNALKYAFPSDSKGKIVVQLKKSKDKLKLVVRDNGVGIPISIDLITPETLGLQLVEMLTKQINGQITYQKAKGTRCTIIFNEEEASE
jgi:PAS domain S-box-containing protein